MKVIDTGQPYRVAAEGDGPGEVVVGVGPVVVIGPGVGIGPGERYKR